jgi:hypothetical protein
MVDYLPSPQICPDCFHEECLKLADAWNLLYEDWVKNGKQG